jgi:hypothetical protein
MISRVLRSAFCGLLLCAAFLNANAQRLQEGMFADSGPDAPRKSIWTLYSALQDSVLAYKPEQQGFAVTIHTAWSTLGAFNASTNFQAIREITEKTHPDWNLSQIDGHLYAMQYGPLQGALPDLGEAGRPRGARITWLQEDLLPVSLTLGTGMTPVLGYVEGTLISDESKVGFQADELRWVSYMDDYNRLKAIDGGNWYWPSNDYPVIPKRTEMPYLELGVGKQLNSIWGIHALYRLPFGMRSRILEAHNERNLRFDSPSVKITPDAQFHGGQHFSGLLSCRGKHLVWTLEAAWITAPEGSWATYLIENGATPLEAMTYWSSGVGFVF